MNVERCATHENIECPICADKAEIERLRAERDQLNIDVLHWLSRAAYMKDARDQLRLEHDQAIANYKADNERLRAELAELKRQLEVK